MPSLKMYLLCIKVKRGKLNGPPDKFNVYVTVEVQNLKSITGPIRGNEPSWEQDYMFEINNLEKGLFVEVWDKGFVWDTLLGSVWIPLMSVEHGTKEGPGKWWLLNSVVIMEGAEVCGVENPTHHKILLDTYYELPTEIPEDEADFLIQRLLALHVGKDTECSGDDAEDEMNHKDANEHPPLHSLAECPFEDLDDDYCGDHSPPHALPQRSTHAKLTWAKRHRRMEAQQQRRDQEEENQVLIWRKDLESCSVCGNALSLQKSLGIQTLDKDKMDSYPVESATCHCSQLEHLTSQASLSEAVAGYVPVVSEGNTDPTAASPSKSSAPLSAGSPAPAQKTEEQPAGVSCMDEAEPGVPCGTANRQELRVESGVCSTSQASSRWTTALQKHISGDIVNI
ncbi:protein unc-13 homolog B-like [Brienomyrus brachyistius]|uniref:protein unc-13 homolog B-like n=1 Tax=Brienomyrus brachyistius TaxID=42636 RepID=UPI0020B3B690|nr:protein unc-13 homolog B-like [Brienomyrus brachyistius]